MQKLQENIYWTIQWPLLNYSAVILATHVDSRNHSQFKITNRHLNWPTGGSLMYGTVHTCDIFQTNPEQVSVHLQKLYPKQVFHRLLVKNNTLNNFWTKSEPKTFGGYQIC